MTYNKHSDRRPDELDGRIREAAQRHKFGVLHVHDLTATLKSKGIELGHECRVYDVCNPQAASEALRSDPRIAAVLPCRIAVTADSSGSTLSTVNPTDLMRATGLAGVEQIAAEVEREIVAIIDEAI
jgi:uncharacterized protein (DUF302 family)